MMLLLSLQSFKIVMKVYLGDRKKRTFVVLYLSNKNIEIRILLLLLKVLMMKIMRINSLTALFCQIQSV